MITLPIVVLVILGVLLATLVATNFIQYMRIQHMQAAKYFAKTVSMLHDVAESMSGIPNLARAATDACAATPEKPTPMTREEIEFLKELFKSGATNTIDCATCGCMVKQEKAVRGKSFIEEKTGFMTLSGTFEPTREERIVTPYYCKSCAPQPTATEGNIISTETVAILDDIIREEHEKELRDYYDGLGDLDATFKKICERNQGRSTAERTKYAIERALYARNQVREKQGCAPKIDLGNLKPGRPMEFKDPTPFKHYPFDNPSSIIRKTEPVPCSCSTNETVGKCAECTPSAEKASGSTSTERKAQ
ncbi:MAG: hypothetical protein C4586_08390 [Anaerolineaceae bacterium]|nr:MAG: hypothetical protein C4586_08390 [Anaerolineaceae bacterium]